MALESSESDFKFTFCIVMANIVNLYGPQFLHMYSDNNTAYLGGLLFGSRVIMSIKFLADSNFIWY